MTRLVFVVFLTNTLFSLDCHNCRAESTFVVDRPFSVKWEGKGLDSAINYGWYVKSVNASGEFLDAHVDPHGPVGTVYEGELGYEIDFLRTADAQGSYVDVDDRRLTDFSFSGRFSIVHDPVDANTPELELNPERPFDDRGGPNYILDDFPLTWDLDLAIYEPADAELPSYRITGNGLGTVDLGAQRFGQVNPDGFHPFGTDLAFGLVEYTLHVPEPTLTLPVTFGVTLLALRSRRRRAGMCC